MKLRIMAALCQRFAAQQFHRDEHDAVVGRRIVVMKQIEDSADVRMRDLAGEVDFLLEPLDRSRICCGFRPHSFERHASAEFQVFGFVHRSHAALSDQADDPEAAANQLCCTEVRMGRL